MPGCTGSGTADCTILLSSTTRSVTFTPAESCTPYGPVRWHDHVPRDSRIQDEGTADGLFITVLVLRTFKTIQVTQGSAVLPNLQRARATAPHGSYRFDPCAAGNLDHGKGILCLRFRRLQQDSCDCNLVSLLGSTSSLLPTFTTGSNCPSTVGGGNELKFLLRLFWWYLATFQTAAAFISLSRYLNVVSWTTNSSQCRVARRHDHLLPERHGV